MPIANNVHHPALTLLFLAAIRPIAIGDVVTYHGSIRSEHDGEFIVVKIAEDGRMKIRYRDYQEHSLSNVRRSSVVPTGEHVEVCDCGHTRDNTRGPGHTHMCRVFACDCVKHGTAPIEMTNAARHLLFAIIRTARYLREGTEATTKDIALGDIAHRNDAMVLRALNGPRLDTLTALARTYIRECPELGLTTELLDIALSDDPSALHPE